MVTRSTQNVIVKVAMRQIDLVCLQQRSLFGAFIAIVGKYWWWKRYHVLPLPWAWSRAIQVWIASNMELAEEGLVLLGLFRAVGETHVSTGTAGWRERLDVDDAVHHSIYCRGP